MAWSKARADEMQVVDLMHHKLYSLVPNISLKKFLFKRMTPLLRQSATEKCNVSPSL